VVNLGFKGTGLQGEGGETQEGGRPKQKTKRGGGGERVNWVEMDRRGGRAKTRFAGKPFSC